MYTKSLLVLALLASPSLLGCVAGGEPPAERDPAALREAPASLQQRGVARYASDTAGDLAELTLLSDQGEVLGALSAVKDAANESLEITLALPGHELALAKSRGDLAITLDGRPASASEAMPELEIARELLTAEGFLPPAEGPAQAAHAAALALQSPGPESAYCGPESGGCYRSSNQAWACFKAKPACLAGYCSQSACTCVDDTQWYDLYHVYICCASASCN